MENQLISIKIAGKDDHVPFVKYRPAMIQRRFGNGT